jgi:DNA-directed RNA polymerase subunit RPC12/RpoP
MYQCPSSMYQCPTCAAETTDRGRSLMGPRCWLCGSRLFKLEPTAPQPDLSPTWAPIVDAIKRQRADVLAESEV